VQVLISVAFVPATPLLVPPIAQGAAHELTQLRQASLDAVTQLVQSGADQLVVVGTALVTGPATGKPDWSGFGVGSAPTAQALSPSLSIGAWLLDQVGAQADPYIGVSPQAKSIECAALGQSLVGEQPLVGEQSVAVLVVGDGSACRSDKAPGSLDPRAKEFDSEVIEALRLGDPKRLAQLDSDLATELQVDGRAPWQVVAAMVDAPMASHVVTSDDPYGVLYVVAHWSAA
jgi:hypothetical protein